MIDSCLHEVELKADSNEKLQTALTNAKQQFNARKDEVKRLNNLVALDAKINTITSLKDDIINKMDTILIQKVVTSVTPSTPSKPRTKKVRQLQRAVIFNQVNLTSAEDVERYLSNIKNRLLSYINDDEEIQIK